MAGRSGCQKKFVSSLGMLGIINAYSRGEVYLEVGVGLLIGATGKFLGTREGESCSQDRMNVQLRNMISLLKKTKIISIDKG